MWLEAHSVLFHHTISAVDIGHVRGPLYETDFDIFSYLVFLRLQDAFRKAGRPDQSLRMLERLTHNAVTEHRCDAGLKSHSRLR